MHNRSKSGASFTIDPPKTVEWFQRAAEHMKGRFRGVRIQESEDEMILRDYLAYDRTKFALLRTILSIGRTALGLLALAPAS